MQKMPKNKKMHPVTIIVVLVLIGLGVFFIFKHKTVVAPSTTTETPVSQAPTAISISEVPINETNYSGKSVVITGSGTLADTARAYIADEIATFSQEANSDIMPDVPSGQDTIDIEGSYQKGSAYDSIILSEYLYTGGANGMSIYKVFTTSHATGAITSIKDIIAQSEEQAFVTYVKQKLLAYEPDSNTDYGQVIFPEDIANVTMDSFDDWSMDDKNLTLYFDKDTVAAGAVGAIKLDLPLSEVAKFLK
jgi:hypothetical protein